jgi:DNA-binding PadR family transcriptional regulator
VKRARSIGTFDRRILVLTSLAGGPKPGYALIKDIESFAHVSLGPGTLYGCIAQLEEEGLIEALSEEKRRRPYGLTTEGFKVLRSALKQSSDIAAVGWLRLSGSGG